MNTEEKAKAYDKAIERAKNFIENGDKRERTIAESIFAGIMEESEDEKIRKWIIEDLKLDLEEILCKVSGDYDERDADDKERQVYLERALAWLKKQGEQKPKESTDLKTWKYIVDAVLTERGGIGQYLDSPWITDVAKKLQERFGRIEQKPVEWSEEDEKTKNELINSLVRISANTRTDSTSPNYSFSREIEWLNSIRPQSYWKPSEEQLEYLNGIITRYRLEGFPAKVLGSLYEELKAL